MTMAASEQVDRDEMDEPRVVDYLRRYPDLFERHPDLLETLTLDHPTGNAVSLIERQVDVLRSRNGNLRARLATLLDTARDNEQRVMRIHRLSRSLLKARGLQPTATVIKRRLRDDFDVDAATVAVLSDHPKRGSNPRYIGPEDPLRESLRDFFRTRKSFCGQLDEEAMKQLFPGKRRKLRSVAIAPLDRVGKLGLLAVASRDEDRFSPSMGTLFLDMTAELATSALQRYL